MGILEFVLEKLPGKVIDNPDCVIIEHNNGDTSTFYKAKNTNFPCSLPEHISSIYKEFDGINLFSSTFNFSPVNNPTNYEGVDVFTSIELLKHQMEDVSFPERSISFLNETGNFIYSASYESNTIFCFDVEYGEIDIYESVYDIVDNWIEAVKDEI